MLLGGLIAGMSVFASETAPPDLISPIPIDQRADGQGIESVSSPRNFARCAKAGDGPVWGSLGGGIHCEGQKRVICGSDV
jgi:hypothetical protein